MSPATWRAPQFPAEIDAYVEGTADRSTGPDTSQHCHDRVSSVVDDHGLIEHSVGPEHACDRMGQIQTDDTVVALVDRAVGQRETSLERLPALVDNRHPGIEHGQGALYDTPGEARLGARRQQERTENDERNGAFHSESIGSQGTWLKLVARWGTRSRKP